MSKINKSELFSLTANQLSVKYNVTVSAVYHLRKVVSHPVIKINNYATNFLLEINTPEKAYILGLLIADGTVTKYSIVLSLHQNDVEILEKIHKLLQLSTPILNKSYSRSGFIDKYSYQSILTIYSKVLCENLLKYGLIPNKTHTTFFPDIPENLYSHFIRGVFDGDGCVHIDKTNNLHIKIVGNSELLIRIQEIIVNKCEVSSTKIVHCPKAQLNIVAIQHGGNLKTIKILDYIYKDATLFMSRKYQIYKQFKK